MAREITLAAVGDLMLGDSPQVFGFGSASMIRRHGPDFPYAQVRDQLAADITVGNLEVVVSRFDPATTPFDSQVYRGQPEALDGVAAAGFDVVSVCTNHMMQHGHAALEETVTLLQERGIQVIGADIPGLGLANGSIVERNGLRLGFLAFNFRPQQYFVAPPAWPTPSYELIRDAMAVLRPRVDVLVLALHWGDEFIDQPSPAQVDLAHRLVEAGADVILGHHTHIVQGVERYQGAVIAYSLGNFVYDQWQERLRRSMVLRLVIRGPRDIEATALPLLINHQHQPAPFPAERRAEGERWLEELSRKVGSVDAAEYQRILAAEYGRFRRDIYLHYLTQWWRFNPRFFLANVTGAIRRRL
jgi:poly-gamma-glutamate synthesis protein (capsule biosynthesis protein)